MAGLATLPNALTVSRLVTAPGLVVVAALGHDRLFLGLLLAALATDVVDGPIARATQQVSERGASLDSIADAVLYAAASVAVVVLHPALVRQHPWLIVSILGAWALPIAIGLVRFQRVTSYHTVLAKLAGITLTLAGLAFLVADVIWPLRIAATTLVLSAVEEIAITYVLPGWLPDVSSLLAARRLSRSMSVAPAPALKNCVAPRVQ